MTGWSVLLSLGDSLCGAHSAGDVAVGIVHQPERNEDPTAGCELAKEVSFSKEISYMMFIATK
jgi:hypothetical protein